MASLISAFEYDIFISYRQKDNKHDGWVTEFVNNLKGELESTFKEEISVYFDINPHDGLLETHDVGASLKEKLKCLIFIPIISRTYYDPKSFAWEHEFKAFVEMASKDQFGLKVKLPGGNVASRVLPIQIHDLDPEDKKCIEGELGGFIRGIEFIYKEPGVDRPLKPDDKEEKNLYATKYKNQVNKVAHAIRSIVSGLKNADYQSEPSESKVLEKLHGSRKKEFIYILSAVILLSLLFVGGLLAYLHKKNSEPIEKSIAVLPFKLLSDEPDKQYMADGMMDAITLNLSKIKDLRVLGRTSTEQYRNQTRTTSIIGKELDVSYLLEGSFQKYGDSLRLIVQLIRTGKEGHVWANNYDREWKNIFSMQSEVAQSISKELRAAITPEEKNSILKIPTSNLTAYDFYMQGIEQLSGHYYYAEPDALNQSENSFIEALEYDSTFSLAYSGLALVYRLKNNAKQYYSAQYLDSCRMLIDKSLKFDNKNAEAYYIKALYFWDLGRWDLVSQELENALKYNPNYTDVYSFRGDLFYTWNYDNIDYIKAAENLLKAASLNRGKDLPDLLYSIGFLFEDFCGFPDVANYYFNEALKLEKDSVNFWDVLSTLYRDEGNYLKAIELARKTIAATDSVSGYALRLANYLSFNGNNKESLIWYIKYFEWVKKNNTLETGSYHRIAYACWMNGRKEEALSWFNEQKKYCKETIEKRRWYIVGSYYDLAAVNAFLGDKKEAYKYLNLFSQIPVCPKWWLTMIKNDPLFYPISNEIEFLNIVADLERKYNAEHERVGKWLKLHLSEIDDPVKTKN